MEQEKIFKILAAMFAMRAQYWANKSKEKYDEMAVGLSCAYDDAFDMLAYAVNGRWDCLFQFGWSDEAEDLINKVGIDIDFYELEDLIRGSQKNGD